MDNTNIQKLRETLAKNNNFAVVTGENPSLDEMAATLSLYFMLKNAEKKVIVACPSEPLVEISSLVGIDRVQNNLGGDAGDLVVSFPYVEGEIEKVSYTLENGFLNIIVKAAEQGLSFDEKDVKYVRGSGKIDVLFVIGTPKLSALGNLFDSEKLRDTKIINIDNKPENQGYGDIILTSNKLSSVSEQIADLALTLGFRIDKDMAQNLLGGITYATKNFQDPATSPLAFEMVALLLKKGASRGRDNAAREAAVPMPRRDDRSNGQPQFLPKRDETRRPQEQLTKRDDNNRPQQRNAQRFPTDQRNTVADRGFSGQPKSNTPQSQYANQAQPYRNQNQFQDKNQIEEKSSQMPEEDGDTPPVDWLTPKVYKSSDKF